MKNNAKSFHYNFFSIKKNQLSEKKLNTTLIMHENTLP